MRTGLSAVLLLLLVAILTSCSDNEDVVVLPTSTPTSAPVPSPTVNTTVPQTQVGSGVALTLESVNASTGNTELVFLLALPDFAVSSAEPDVLGPLFLNDHVQLNGVQPLPEGLTLRMRPHQAGEPSLRFTLILGPVEQATDTFTITFLALPLGDATHRELITGPWTFVVMPG